MVSHIGASHAGTKSRLAPQPSGSQTSNWSYSNPLGMRIRKPPITCLGANRLRSHTRFCSKIFPDLKAMCPKNPKCPTSHRGYR